MVLDLAEHPPEMHERRPEDHVGRGMVRYTWLSVGLLAAERLIDCIGD
jgi:hypothetical protein